MSDMLAQHHFSSQNGTATRAGPNVTLDVRDLFGPQNHLNYQAQ